MCERMYICRCIYMYVCVYVCMYVCMKSCMYVFVSFYIFSIQRRSIQHQMRVIGLLSVKIANGQRDFCTLNSRRPLNDYELEIFIV